MRGTTRTRASAARMAERGESSDDEPTIAEDVVVTKYKMAGDMANRTSPPALTLIRAHYAVAEKVDCVFQHYILFFPTVFLFFQFHVAVFPYSPPLFTVVLPNVLCFFLVSSLPFTLSSLHSFLLSFSPSPVYFSPSLPLSPVLPLSLGGVQEC